MSESQPLLQSEFIQQQDFLPTTAKQSTTMSMLNLMSLIVGLGFITIPYAFSTLGWISAIVLIIILTLLAIYSAIKIQESLTIVNENLALDELANRAFGNGSGVIVDMLITLQLILLSSASLILFADGMIFLFPQAAVYKRLLVVLGFLLVTPFGITELYSVRLMSVVAILSALTLLITIIYDGATTSHRPGSFKDPMETSYLPKSLSSALSIGLVFVSFDSHALIPSVIRDMKNQDDFKRSVIIVYSLIGAFYTILGVLGYIMFGELTEPEIYGNLFDAKFVRWMASGTIFIQIMNPLVKYPVILGPVNRAVERVAGVQSRWLPTSRLIVSVAVAAIAVGFPSFAKVMGLMGSFLSFLVAGVIPILIWIKLDENSDKTVASFAMMGSGILMVLGTVGVFY